MRVLRDLCGLLRLYKNFFQPAMKLQSKERVGGKIRRKYDVPRTPYQRLLESGQLSRRAEKELRKTYESLNVAELQRQIEALRDRLFGMVAAKNTAVPRPRRGKLLLSIGAADRRRQWLKHAASR